MGGDPARVASYRSSLLALSVLLLVCNVVYWRGFEPFDKEWRSENHITVWSDFVYIVAGVVPLVALVTAWLCFVNVLLGHRCLAPYIIVIASLFMFVLWFFMRETFILIECNASIELHVPKFPHCRHALYPQKQTVNATFMLTYTIAFLYLFIVLCLLAEVVALRDETKLEEQEKKE